MRGNTEAVVGTLEVTFEEGSGCSEADGDRKCENSGQVGTGPIWHPEIRNSSEGTKRIRRPVPEKARSRGTSMDPSTARIGG